jgi:PAS domain S-box-containing protein
MHTNQSKILYIDDEIINLQLFKLTFGRDYKIFTTTSTNEAREILEANLIKVVITDLRMPSESGIDFIQSVSQQYPNIFYIILTAFLDIEAALRAINQVETFRYLLKPWNAEILKSTINDAINLYDITWENRLLIKQLKDRKSQFHAIFYHSKDGIVIYRSDGSIIKANPAFIKTMHCQSKKPRFLRTSTTNDYAESFEKQMLTAFNNNKKTISFQLENTQNYIEVNFSIVEFEGEPVAIGIIRDITERHLSNRKTFNMVMNAEERERNRLASELHEGIGPILSTVKMYIEWLCNKERSGNHEQVLSLAYKLIDEAIVQVRNISHDLSPHVLEKFGLETGLQSHIELLKRSSNIEFILDINIKRRLPKMAELTLYKAIKECIANTLKHANAHNVFIMINQIDRNTTVVYADNGCGFDIENTLKTSKGIGMYNIQNRIESLGGNVEFSSAPNMGTRVKLELKD